MPQFDTLIVHGLVVTDGTVSERNIGINRGAIAAILDPTVDATAQTAIDASGCVITPGGIDTHTHISWPYDGKTTVDGPAGATRAAVLTGTTTVVDFVPPDEAHRGLRAACHDRADELAAASFVDFGLHPILTDASDATLDAIPLVVRDGFTSFKMYTTYQDRRIDDGDAWTLMNAIAAERGLPGFHAENHELIEAESRRIADTGRLGPVDFPASRPALAEAEAIQMVSLYARKIGTPVYIFHVSGAEPLAVINDAVAHGSRVFAETCTHYLTFDERVFAERDAWRYIISPPIRRAADREALWEAIRRGTVVSVGSDHCAYSVGDKSASIDDFRETPAGAPGIEARTPILRHAAISEHGFDWAGFVAINSERAARALGLERKGHIAVGYDADLVIWDLEKPWAGNELMISSPDTFTLYDRVSGVGLPRTVLLRGERVVTDGALSGAAPTGQFIVRGTQRRAD